MTLFEPIPSLRERALALPHMLTLLQHVADQHDFPRLHKTITRDAAEKGIPGHDGNKELYIDAARNAGLLEAEPAYYGKTTGLSLTPEGYAAIGRDLPLWRVA